MMGRQVLRDRPEIQVLGDLPETRDPLVIPDQLVSVVTQDLQGLKE